MGDITDQVGTLDTTGFGGVPNIEEVMTAPELLEAPEEGEEEAAQEARQIVVDESGEVTGEQPEITSLAESEAAAAEEEAEEESGAEVTEEEAVPDEVPAEEEAAEEEAEEVAGSGYDPGDHSVAEVITYVQNNPNEREAIVAAEKAGKGRKGILDL